MKSGPSWATRKVFSSMRSSISTIAECPPRCFIWDIILMKTLQEIEAAIAQLSRQEFLALVRHLHERHAAEWDRQIEEDANSGRLQDLYQRLETENEGQPKVLPLNSRHRW